MFRRNSAIQPVGFAIDLCGGYGYNGEESTARRYVGMAKMKLELDHTGAFIPCDPEAGIEA